MPLPRKLYKTLSQCSVSSLNSPATTSVDENGRGWLTTLPTLPTQRNTFGKDARAYQYERQRIKKAADFVKMRSRKARGAEWTGNKAHQSSASVASATLSEKGIQLQEEEDENDDLEELVLFDSRQDNTGVIPFMTEPSLHPPRYEVRLADFVRTGKPRKPKGDGDFEVIPHIRSVIVLDDNTPDGFGEDEPWEYVSNPDSEPNKGLSYAEVAALSM